jgi:hypothetical protein
MRFEENLITAVTELHEEVGALFTPLFPQIHWSLDQIIEVQINPILRWYSKPVPCQRISDVSRKWNDIQLYYQSEDIVLIPESILFYNCFCLSTSILNPIENSLPLTNRKLPNSHSQQDFSSADPVNSVIYFVEGTNEEQPCRCLAWSTLIKTAVLVASW